MIVQLDRQVSAVRCNRSKLLSGKVGYNQAESNPCYSGGEILAGPKFSPMLWLHAPEAGDSGT